VSPQALYIYISAVRLPVSSCYTRNESFNTLHSLVSAGSGIFILTSALEPVRLLLNWCWWLSPRVMRPKRQADYSCASVAAVKKTWKRTSKQLNAYA